MGVAAVLGSVVVVLEGIQSRFGFQTNWTTYRKTAEALKREQYLYLAQAAQYAGDDREKVLAVFVESLISDETTRWAATRSSRSRRRRLKPQGAWPLQPGAVPPDASSACTRSVQSPLRAGCIVASVKPPGAAGIRPATPPVSVAGATQLPSGRSTRTT